MENEIKRSFKDELTRPWTIAETIRAAVVAAMYGALAVIMGPLMFGPFQLRLSDSLAMVAYDKKYGGRAVTVGILVSCFIVNLFSPYGGLVDSLIGIPSGLVTLGLIWWLGIKFNGNDKGKWFASMSDVAIAQFTVAYLLLYKLFGVPFWEAQWGVFVGDFVSIALVGFVLLKAIEKTYKKRA